MARLSQLARCYTAARGWNEFTTTFPSSLNSFTKKHWHRLPCLLSENNQFCSYIVLDDAMSAIDVDCRFYGGLQTALVDCQVMLMSAVF